MEERSSEEDSDRNFRNFNKRKLDTDIAQEFLRIFTRGKKKFVNITRTILKERVELKNYYEIITGKEGKKITILSRFDTSRLNYNLS